MPEVSPRAPGPHHAIAGSRRTSQQQPSEPSSIAGDEAPGTANQPTTPTDQTTQSINPTAETNTENANITGRRRGGGTRRNTARRSTKGQPVASPHPDSLTTEQRLRRTRLAAMARPRPNDTPELAGLRRVLSDEQYMAQVTAAVDQWPPLTDEQRETIAALLNPLRRSA